MKVVVESEKGIIMRDVERVDSFSKRFMGLMGRKIDQDYSGMLLLNCSSIHTFFMKSEIDVVYLSKNYEVLAFETIKPWRVGRLVKGARHVIEMPAQSNRFSKGDIITVKNNKVIKIYC